MTDYISRETLLNDKAFMRGGKASDPYVCGYLDALDNLEKVVEAIPAADVVEVVHGEWKPLDLAFGRSIYVCTACERTVKMPTAMGLPTFKYCPNCGAKTIVMHEPDINPCRGCDDYDGFGECVSDGGCARKDGDVDA